MSHHFCRGVCVGEVWSNFIAAPGACTRASGTRRPLPLPCIETGD